MSNAEEIEREKEMFFSLAKKLFGAQRSPTTGQLMPNSFAGSMAANMAAAFAPAGSVHQASGNFNPTNPIVGDPTHPSFFQNMMGAEPTSTFQQNTSQMQPNFSSVWGTGNGLQLHGIGNDGSHTMQTHTSLGMHPSTTDVRMDGSTVYQGIVPGEVLGDQNTFFQQLGATIGSSVKSAVKEQFQAVGQFGVDTSTASKTKKQKNSRPKSTKTGNDPEADVDFDMVGNGERSEDHGYSGDEDEDEDEDDSEDDDGSEDGDSDTDDEMNGIRARKSKKVLKPRKSGKQKHRKSTKKDKRLKPIHKDMRDVFERFKLVFSLDGNLPVYVTEEELRKFEENEIQHGPLLPVRPDQALPLEWNRTLGKSAWNRRVVEILSRYYFDRLKSGRAAERGDKGNKAVFIEDVTTLKWVTDVVKKNLIKIRSDVQHRDVFSAREVVRKKNGRLGSRRHVRHNARERIADFFIAGLSEYKIVLKDEDVQAWSDIKSALEDMGADLESDDQTDGCDEFGIKQVRRLAQPFLNQEVIAYKRAIDTYIPFVNEVLDKEPSKVLLKRLTSSLRNDPDLVIGLPKNWYDKEWYKSLSDAKKAKLQAGKFRAIPKLSPYKKPTSASASAASTSAMSRIRFDYKTLCLNHSVFPFVP
ncbi:hypothetical protein SCHPADRAFT_947433 [Schizopora paradoxa]|uniref:Uncharacterized protein n=1 Tax=Schizopora paradoxa TaxID=27342 RepID=A0A0H2RIY7_9AGAM|nr:hypothetical protein SCHPADRAFT_947433 [Schizopora paradoxa]